MQVTQLKTDLFGLKIDMTDIKDLTILVGTNGTGKTVANKCIYLSAYALFMKAISMMGEIPAPIRNSISPELRDGIYGSMFDISPEDEGSWTCIFEGGTEVTISFKNKEFFEEFKYLPEKFTGDNMPAKPTYISSAFRNFKYVTRILKDLSVNSNPYDLLDDYPISDIFAALQLQYNVQKNPKIDGKLAEMLNEQGGSNSSNPIKEIRFEEESKKFIINKQTGSIRADLAGAGEQALIIMHKTIV